MLRICLAVTATLVVPSLPCLQASILRDLAEPALFSAKTEGRIADLSIHTDKDLENHKPADLTNKHYGWSIDDPQHGISANGSTDASAITKGGLFPSTEVVVESKIKDGAIAGGARDYAEAAVVYTFEVKPAIPLPPVSGLAGWVHIATHGRVEVLSRSGDVFGIAYAYFLVPDLMFSPLFPPIDVARIALTPGGSESFDLDEKLLVVPGKYQVAIGGWVRVTGEDGTIKLKSIVDPIIEIAPESEGLFELHLSSNLSDDVPDTAQVPEPPTSALAGACLLTLVLIRKMCTRRVTAT